MLRLVRPCREASQCWRIYLSFVVQILKSSYPLMKKLTLLLAGLMIAGFSYAAPCDKDKDKACCKGKSKTECKKEAKADCKEKSACCKKGTATAKK
jgi:hypothetical protein